MSRVQLPYCQSCENNKGPILAKLKLGFANTRQVVEIGSGTGQHAVYFARHLPHLNWYPSEQAELIPTLARRIVLEGGNNLHPPLTLQIGAPWPSLPHPSDGIFTANTLHIMSKALVAAFFSAVDDHLSAQGNLCIYGPFNYHNRYSSDSNRRFDAWLKQRNADSGIRDAKWIVTLAQQADLSLIADHAMPANNRLLHFRRKKGPDGP